MRTPRENTGTYGIYLILLALVAAFGAEIYYLNVFGEDFLRSYMLSMQNIENGIYISVITSVFLHAGIIHLASNAAAIYLFGKPVERRLGGFRTVLLFVISGVLGGLVQLLFTPDAFLVGASGGAFGIAAAAMLLDPGESLMEEVPIVRWFSFPIIRNLFSVVFISALFIVGETQASLFMDLTDQVAHIAHLAGFATGGLLTYWWRPIETKKGSLIAVPFLGLLGLLAFPFGTPRMEQYALIGLLVLIVLVRLVARRNP